jgi:ABC-2 type transport system permease protein
VNASALSTMLVVELRTGWKALVTWVLALAATMIATTTSISGLYDTQAKIESYAAAVRSGDALVAINGRVAGIDTLGGVVANEFGFMASFAVPLMGISLVARMTRKDEEHGRLEALLAGRIGRSAPVVAAVLVATAALVVTGGALFLGLVAVGIPAADSFLYAASMAALGFVFACVAALVAQVVEHTRGVYAAGLAILVVSYLLRGIGAVLENPLTWLSPLGWQEETRAFGDGSRWWPLVVPVLVGLVLFGVAATESGRRDLGSALFRRGASSPRASAVLRTSVGFASRMQRGSMLGWAVGSAVVAATFGALAQPMIDAFAGNESLADAMGAAGGGGLDAVLTMSALLLALLGAAYAVQSVGLLRGEESAGRLEAALAGSQGRWSWLATHLLVIVVGILVVMAVGGVALSVGVFWSTGEGQARYVAEAVAAYVPAILVLAGVALLLFGLLPRAQAAAWVVYGVAALVAYLGEPLQLSEVVLALSPFHHVGSPPQENVDAVALTWLSLAALGLVALAFVGFRRRGVPQV